MNKNFKKYKWSNIYRMLRNQKLKPIRCKIKFKHMYQDKNNDLKDYFKKYL